MYSFLFDQTYLNLLILVIIVTLVMFLWRKLIILEGNFFVLEKRVNLIKKDAREDSISRNIEKSDTIMNEIFRDFSTNACKQSKCGGGMSVCVPPENTPYIVDDDEDMVQFVPEIITFSNGGNLVVDSSGSEETEVIAEEEDRDIDRMVDTIISSSEEYEKKVRDDALDDNENDTMSVSSEITFGDDKKALMKKYSKLSLDKLRELCNLSNVSNEGTKNELIKRITEAKK
jgi:hypothetical protein